MATAGKKREQRGEPGRAHAEGLGGGDGGQDERELVGEPDEQHVGGRHRLAAEAGEPEVDGAGEAAPAVACLEPATDPLVGHGDEDDAQRQQGDEGEADGHLGGAAEVLEGRVHEEARRR